MLGCYISQGLFGGYACLFTTPGYCTESLLSEGNKAYCAAADSGLEKMYSVMFIQLACSTPYRTLPMSFQVGVSITMIAFWKRLDRVNVFLQWFTGCLGSFSFLLLLGNLLLCIVSNSYMNLIVGSLVSKQIPLYCKCFLSNMETHVQCRSTDLNLKGQSSLAAWGLNAHLGMLLLWSAVAVLQACRGPPSLRLQAFFLAFGDVYHFLFVKLRNPEEHG